jgi:hypothetical protein
MNRRIFKKLVVDATGGCTVQHNGWPCNTCFHAIDAKELGLKEDIHSYWIATLAYRGDYPDIEQEPKLIAELYNALRVEG